MKIVFCPSCGDYFRLWPGKFRWCRCKASAGRYIDEKNAEIKGKAIPLGLDNHTFVKKIEEYLLMGKRYSVEVEGFVIPMPCRTIKKIDKRKD